MRPLLLFAVLAGALGAGTVASHAQQRLPSILVSRQLAEAEGLRVGDTAQLAVDE
ncbi:MAG: hypothetical protein HY824_17355 [Acidobacteria bacterium]|nr:hypothetical protein [Acidobacteriota bacterium]